MKLFDWFERATGMPRSIQVPDKAPKLSELMLNVDQIYLHYGAAQALRGVSLTAKAGEVTCVLGRNGVGKTSLLRAIVGQQPISSGSILWDGQDISRQSQHARAHNGIAIVPQGREIFPLLTVRENLETGFAVAGPGNRFVPDDVFELFPVLKDMLGRRGGDLSGGQQQQLAIGRAMTMRPKLLVLDEPTEGIQPSIIKDIGRAIDYLRSKGEMAIVLVEQYFEFARDLADAYAVLDRGQVVLAGSRSDMDEEHVRRHLSV
jgi:urea transport system ATP-binding protein